MIRIIFTALPLLLAHLLAAQTYTLPAGLHEISGLAVLDNHTLIAINDGGNEPDLYLISLKGEAQRTVRVAGATNEDWEDLASDGTYLYIGDIGNNLNKRKNLCVYKVLLEDIRTKQEVSAQKITFSYREQTSFPPVPQEKRYDAEGMAFFHGELWIFTKINDDPWTGKSLVYRVPVKPGHYELSADQHLFTGPGGWWKDAITAADHYGDSFYILTYDRVLQYKWEENTFKCVAGWIFPEATQKESVVVVGKNIFVADEKQLFLGGGNLYQIPISSLNDHDIRSR